MIDTKEKQRLCESCKLKKRRNYFCFEHGDEVRRVIRDRTTCAGWGNEPPPIVNRKINNLAVVTCHFNPCGFKAPVRNYHEFKAKLGVPLTTVEMSFTGRFEFDDSIKIKASAKNNMWQKERLLNIGIESLPKDVDAVAWVDADVIFQNPNWYEDTRQLLSVYPAVQMYDRVDYQGPDGDVIQRTASWAHNYSIKDTKAYGAPGFAWAARREAIPDGLYDLDIVGGGDCHLLASWLDETMYVQRSYAGMKEWTDEFLEWKSRQLPRVKSQIGCVNGHAYHLFHGTRENRQYLSRVDILKRHDFTVKDIRIGDNVLWEWATDKPGLHRDVAEYFRARKEDK